MMLGTWTCAGAWRTRLWRFAAHCTVVSAVIFFASQFANADDSAWDDAYYSYRVPLRIDAPKIGRYRIDLDADAVTAWINQAALFTFKPEHFAYDQIMLVAVSKDGSTRPVDAQFELTLGDELMRNGDFEANKAGKPADWAQSATGFTLQRHKTGGTYLAAKGADRNAMLQTVPTQKRTWYRYTCRQRGSGVASPHIYRINESWQPIDASWRDPYLEPDIWRDTAYSFYTGNKDQWQTPDVVVRIERFTGDVDDVSVRECKVALTIDIKKPGAQKYLLYYAPLEGVAPSPPSHVAGKLPAGLLDAQRIGPTQHLEADITYRLDAAASGADLWYAAPTRRVLPHDPPPTLSAAGVTLACARNESEAIQLVLRANPGVTIDNVEAELVGPQGARIAGENIDIRRARYVPIIEPSKVDYTRSSRFNYRGLLPDPLTAFTPVKMEPGDENLLIWIDIHVPTDAPSGTYTGAVRLLTPDAPIVVPVSLTVWDFALPDRSTCRTSLQFSRYANQFVFPYHKVETKQEKYALSQAYIATLAKYRISAKGPMSSGVWNPAGPGHPRTPEDNVRILKAEAPWAFDQLHVNTAAIGHISGPSLEKASPQALQKQVDRILPAATWMKQHDYLQWCIVQIDEPRPVAFDGVRKLIDAFRATEVGRAIPMFGFVYNAECYYALRDHIDILTPINNDLSGVVSPIGIAKRGNKETWFYYTRTAHQWIDSPGLNHRLWAPKVQAFGGKGFAVWGITLWWNNTITKGHRHHNPWFNPHTTWGNGSLAYFYPPNRLGKALPAKDMSIVPSLRLLLTRDGIEDFEYVVILKQLIAEAKQKNIDTADGEAALVAMRRPFITPRSWTIGETYWMAARAAVARAIVQLKTQRP